MHTIARTVARAPLRARLTAASVLLVALGLLAAGVATHYALRSFLIDRVDQEFAPAEAAGAALRDRRRRRVQALPRQRPAAEVVRGGRPPRRRRAPSIRIFHGNGKVTEELAELAEHAPLGYSSGSGFRVRSVPHGAGGGEHRGCARLRRPQAARRAATEHRPGRGRS